jgi:hypothetical protein
MKSKKKYIYYSLLSLILSYLIILISGNKEIWLKTWSLLNVPTMWPAFADIDFIYRSLSCKQMGFDPFVNNPCDISGTTYQYPSIWLYIFKLFNINSILNLKIFLFFSLSLLLFSFCWLFQITKNKFNKFILFLLFFSGSTLLLIERGNIDHIIFIFCVLTILSNNYYYEIIIIFINSCLKIYPIFNFIYLFKKKNFYLTLIIILVTTFFIYEISLARYFAPNHPFMAISQAYGILTIVEGFFKILEKKYLINISFEIKSIVRIFFVLIFLIISFVLFLMGAKKQNKIIYNLNYYEKLFILGSSIYVGTYISFSNIDYRLIFLILTIPYISTLSKFENYFYSIILIIIFNSWFFSFVPLTLSHSLYTIFLYILKMIIFIYLSFNLGKLIGNFFLRFRIK